MAMSDETTLLELLEALHRAIIDRDLPRVWELLDDPRATHLPPRVREEAVMLARQPRGSFRAPIHLLRFAHVTRQLGEDETGEESRILERAGQLRLPLEEEEAGSVHHRQGGWRDES